MKTTWILHELFDFTINPFNDNNNNVFVDFVKVILTEFKKKTFSFVLKWQKTDNGNKNVRYYCL